MWRSKQHIIETVPFIRVLIVVFGNEVQGYVFTREVPEHISHTDTKNHKCVILFSSIVQLQLDLISPEDERVHKTTKAVLEMVSDIQRYMISHNELGVGGIYGIDIVYPTMWSHAEPITVDIREDVPFTITDDLLVELATLQQKNIEQERQQSISLAQKTLGMIPVHASYHHVQVNGYTVENPIGMPAYRLSGRMHIVYAHKQLHEQIMTIVMETLWHHENRMKFTGEKIHERLFGPKLSIHSCTELSSRGAQVLFPKIDHIGILCVDSDISSIALAHGGYMEARGDMAFGIHHITHELGIPTSLIPSVATSGVIKKHQQKAWQHMLQTLKALRSHYVIPHVYAVLGSDDHAYVVPEVVSVQTMEYVEGHKEKVRVVYIGKEYIQSVVSHTDVTQQLSPVGVFLAHTILILG